MGVSAPPAGNHATLADQRFTALDGPSTDSGSCGRAPPTWGLEVSARFECHRASRKNIKVSIHGRGRH
ncbi:hypothetical protein SprV_0100407300 [Sparganum proliferum]